MRKQRRRNEYELNTTGRRYKDRGIDHSNRRPGPLVKEWHGAKLAAMEITNRVLWKESKTDHRRYGTNPEKRQKQQKNSSKSIKYSNNGGVASSKRLASFCQ